MNKVLMQVEKAVNAEIINYNALQYQIKYLKSNMEINKIKPAYGFLRYKQKESLTLAKTIMEALKSINISPMLSGHSLLGAVRHNGFIPWESNMQFALMAHDFWRIETFISSQIQFQNSYNFQWVDSKHTKKKITNDPLKYEKNILEKNILEKEKNALQSKHSYNQKSQEDELAERILKMELEIEANALTKFHYDPFDYFTTLNDCMQTYAQKNKNPERMPIFVMRTPYSLSFYQGSNLEEAVCVQFVPYYFFKKNSDVQKLETQIKLIKGLIQKSITYGMVFHFYDELLKENKHYLQKEHSDSSDSTVKNLKTKVENNSNDDLIYAGINNHEFIRKNLNYKSIEKNSNQLQDSAEEATLHLFKNTDFFPLKTIDFEGDTFNTFNNVDAYLCALFGTYQELPKYLGISPYYVNLNVWLRDNRKRLLTIPEATLI